jgi:hypothetical protein
MRANFVGGENVPNKIWVIQINPTAAESIPRSVRRSSTAAISLKGNVSLMQSLGVCRVLQTSAELQSTVDDLSKLSRAPSHLHRLIENGEMQGHASLESLAMAKAVAA